MAKVQIRCYADPPVGIQLTGQLFHYDAATHARTPVGAAVSIRPTKKLEVELAPGQYVFESLVTTWDHQTSVTLFALIVDPEPEHLLTQRAFSIQLPVEREMTLPFRFTVPK